MDICAMNDVFFRILVGATNGVWVCPPAVYHMIRVAKETYQGWQTCRPPRLFIWKVISYSIGENKCSKVLSNPSAIHSMASLLKSFDDIFRAAIFSKQNRSKSGNPINL